MDSKSSTKRISITEKSSLLLLTALIQQFRIMNRKLSALRKVLICLVDCKVRATFVVIPVKMSDFAMVISCSVISKPSSCHANHIVMSACIF